MRLKNILLALCYSTLLPGFSFADHCGGKIDVGPVFVHVDVLESGRTIKKLDMGGLRADATFMIKEGSGFCIKPNVLYAQGHGELITASLGFGHVTPITDKLCITPHAGGAWTNLRTSVTLMKILHAKERFRSTAPYAAIDLTYKICDGWRVGASYLYSWSRTHTRIQNIGKFKGNSSGPSISALIEHDFNDYWSMHFGGAYNSSLDREKHGIRGYGFKLGVARWLM